MGGEEGGRNHQRQEVVVVDAEAVQEHDRQRRPMDEQVRAIFTLTRRHAAADEALVAGGRRSVLRRRDVR